MWVQHRGWETETKALVQLRDWVKETTVKEKGVERKIGHVHGYCHGHLASMLQQASTGQDMKCSTWVSARKSKGKEHSASLWEKLPQEDLTFPVLSHTQTSPEGTPPANCSTERGQWWKTKLRNACWRRHCQQTVNQSLLGTAHKSHGWTQR